jgi:uncharacterized protein YsxB (DUF464 family)
MRYLPPGPWLLELFDQLYWTADQLQLRQLSSIVWALGRLQLVAVPHELLERLLAYTRMQLQQQQQQQQLAAGGDDVAGSSTSTSSNSTSFTTATKSSSSSSSSKSAAAAQYQLSKQIYKLLLGLAGLRTQLPRSMLQQAGVGPIWIMTVITAEGPMSHVHVPACLHAAAALRLRLPVSQPGAAAAAAAAAGEQGLPSPSAAVAVELSRLQQQQQQEQQQQQQEQQQQQQQQQQDHSYQAAVLSRLSSLKPRLSHTGLTLGLWGAVVLGCRPDSAWLKPWLSESELLLPVATAAEINMLLHACVIARHVPAETWMSGVVVRLREVLSLASERQGVQQSSSSSSSSSGRSSSSSSSSSCAGVGLSGSSMVATLRFLLALQKQQQQQQHMALLTQQQGGPSQQQQQLKLLLRQMLLRMERLEIAGLASPTAVRQFEQHAADMRNVIY